MGQIFSACKDVLISLVFLVPTMAVCNQLVFHRMKRTACYLIFACYCVAVMSLVGIPNVRYVRLDFAANLIPFADMRFDWKNALLNVLLFLPMGFLLPVLWETYRHLKDTAILCLCLSGIIEGLQLFTFRTTDVNDLLTNTAGGILGFLTAKLLTKGFTNCTCSDTNPSDLYLVFGISFAVMFFCVPFLSGYMWR